MGESSRFGWAVWLTRGLLLVVIAMIGSAFFGGEGFGEGADAPPALVSMLVFQAPFVVAFLALLGGRSRFGLGLAASAAMTLLLPLAATAALAIVFAGFTDGIPDARTPLLLGALVPVVLLLAVSALLGLWDAPGEALLHTLLTGLAISISYAILIVGVYKAAEGAKKARWAAAHRSAREVHLLTQQIGKCAKEFAGRHPERGFPRDLAAIRADESACLAGVENGTSGGFRFTYLASPPDERGHRASFSLCAQPVRFEEPDAVTVVVDSTDSGPERGWPSAGATESIACGVAWRALPHAASSLHFCLLSYAAEHQARGFPAQLDAIEACPRSREVRTQWVYRAAPPNAEGRVVRYEATWDEGARSYFTDETGVLRMAEGHTATAADLAYPEAKELQHRRVEAGTSPSAVPGTPPQPAPTMTNP